MQHRMNRKAKKAWIRVLGMAEKSEKMVRIKIKEHELHERKKKFGVEYIDLLNDDATSEEIERYMQSSKSEIAVLEQQIAFLRLEMNKVNEKTNEMLQRHRRRNMKHPDTTQQQQQSCNNNPMDPTEVMQKAHFPDVVPEFASTIPKDPPQAPPINPFNDVDEPKYVSVSTPVPPSAPLEHDN